MTDQILNLPNTSARPERGRLRARPRSRRPDLPARPGSGISRSRSATIRTALLRATPTGQRTSHVSSAAGAGARTRPSVFGSWRPHHRPNPTARAVRARTTSSAPQFNRSRLLDVAGPAALLGGVQTASSLAAFGRSQRATTHGPGVFGASPRATGFTPRLGLSLRPLAPTAGLTSRSTRGRALAAALESVASRPDGLAAERVEAGAERTGQAVADAVVASFERLIPGIVARALNEAERRLLMSL